MEVDFAKVMGDIREIAEAEQRDAEELVDKMADSALKKALAALPLMVVSGQNGSLDGTLPGGGISSKRNTDRNYTLSEMSTNRN